MELFFVPVTFYDCSSDGTIIDQKNDNLFIPIYQNDLPIATSTEIVNSAGLITTAYDNLRAACSDFDLCSWVSKTPGNTNISDFFPQNVFSYTSRPIIEFKKSNYFVRSDTTPWRAYNTLIDAVRDTNEQFRITYNVSEGYLITGSLYLAFFAANDDFSIVQTYTIRNEFNKNLRYTHRSSFVVSSMPEFRRLLTGSDTGIPDRLASDPYAGGGTSTQEGGTGDFDGTSDDIDFPAVPTLSASSTGFIKLYNPTVAQLNALANYMWSNNLFDPAIWKKIFADPMDAILGLSIVPVAVPSGTAQAVTVGNIPTDVNMTVATSQYVELDCGTLNVNEYWGAYLDYDPYTRAEIYLPYIGIKPISVDDIMGKAVAIKYHVDILSGACVAYIKCGDSVLYSYIGQCASSIPITGNDWTNVINGVMSIAGAIGTTVATGGATAPMALGTTASTMVNQMKPNIQKSGGMSGTGGMLAIQKPYMILTRPRQALPENQNTFMGYPSFITLSLADVSGYTEIESIHLENMTGTGAEIAEIESILKTGVIL